MAGEKERFKPRSIKVLWVGNQTRRQPYQATLERCLGGEIIGFSSSPPAALRTLEETDELPDLVVLDFEMDGLSRELLEKLRYHPNRNLKNLPCCCLDASLPEGERSRLERLGDVAFLNRVDLSKPNQIREAYENLLK